jgi:3',5'-cyclic AMP phosphodiesterase CpdA
MFTLLQISDLHRAVSEPFSNEEIMSSLVADVERYPTERPSISKPDAIIVSGDLVQGLPLRSPSYPAGLVAQYEVALDLLKRLTDTFLAGDRSKRPSRISVLAPSEGALAGGRPGSDRGASNETCDGWR